MLEFRDVNASALDWMAEVMRADEKRDFSAVFGTVRNGLEQCCKVSDRYLQAVYFDEEPMAIYGLTSGWIPDPDVANPWLALSRTASLHHPEIVKHETLRVVNEWAKDLKLLCNFVPTFDTGAIRLLRYLGFQFLNEAVITDGIERIPFYMVGGKV